MEFRGAKYEIDICFVTEFIKVLMNNCQVDMLKIEDDSSDFSKYRITVCGYFRDYNYDELCQLAQKCHCDDNKKKEGDKI